MIEVVVEAIEAAMGWVRSPVFDCFRHRWHDLLLEETGGTFEWLERPQTHMFGIVDDSVPHYIVYNADTRVLMMYPNVIVLEDGDVDDVQGFVERLAGPPHYLYVSPDVQLVRQVFVKVAEPRCVEVPHACSRALHRHASASMAVVQ